MLHPKSTVLHYIIKHCCNIWAESIGSIAHTQVIIKYLLPERWCFDGSKTKVETVDRHKHECLRQDKPTTEWEKLK